MGNLEFFPSCKSQRTHSRNSVGSEGNQVVALCPEALEAEKTQ